MSQIPRLTDADVIQYLTDHPEFFVGKDDLLAAMTVPHNSGSASSLVERQLVVHRERNTELRQKMSDLLENARRNDQLFEKTRRLILALVEAEDWLMVETALDDSLRSEFGVDGWALLHFSERLLDAPLKVIRGSDNQRQIQRLFKGHRSLCGVLANEDIAQLLGVEETEQVSVAASQLRGATNIGVLTIASNNEATFRNQMDTLFLDYLGDILAVKLAQIPVVSK